MSPRVPARILVTCLSASVLVAACTSGHDAAFPPSTASAPAIRTSVSAPPPASSSTVSATTTTAPHAAQRLLVALRSNRFDGSDLPAHLHVVGVGPWQYVDAGHVGSGYLGSAKVTLRSDVSRERIDGISDVFTSPAAASAVFAQTYSNFRRYSPSIHGSVRVVQLDPPVGAFCGPQAAPAKTTTCWIVHGSTTGDVTATIPSASDGGDSQAVLQAMLTHLLVVGG